MNAEYSKDKIWAIRANIVTASAVIPEGLAVICGGVITEVLPSGSAVPYPCPLVQETDGWLLPGFIDVHIHGGNGFDFMDGTPEAIAAIVDFHGRHGTTGMLATTVTASKKDIEGVLSSAVSYRDVHPERGAGLYGVHLEGPFISPRWPGAQNPAHIADPNEEWLRTWVEAFPDTIRLLTLAPERAGALDLIRYAAGKGIICACGHTDATYLQMMDGVQAGLTHGVHTFNAMRGLHHREPGTVGAMLTDNRISAEVIADGHHVHPAAIKLLLQSKPEDKVLLITDAIAAAGLPDGEYELGGLPVAVQGGAARLKNGGSLAGSTLTMIDAFTFMVKQVGLSVPAASRLASGNPAKLLGLAGRIGSIAPGMSADLVLLDHTLRIQNVWRQGRRI
jgi:N-acetylglucosamine-6-phosphate deacetylase